VGLNSNCHEFRLSVSLNTLAFMLLRMPAMSSRVELEIPGIDKIGSASSGEGQQGWIDKISGNVEAILGYQPS